MSIPQRPLGSQGLVVSCQGLGCMGMTAFYGSFNRAEQEGENLATIGRALELGINFFDTAWIYQSFGKGGGENVTNESLLGKAIKMYGRDKFIIATKFGILPTATGGMDFNSSPETIRRQLAESLERLGVDYIDLYYQHRVDPKTPIEETVACLKELINEGKIKYIGLSECTPSELRRAHAVHPITAIQMEWSLQTRDIEESVVPTARELGVGIVPYSPLGRGFLTGAIRSAADIDEGDYRRTAPRFAGENLEKNLPTEFFAIAERKGCTPAQLALAWVHYQGNDVFPIPGTKSVKRLEENVQAALISLTAEEVTEIENSIPEIVGPRYASMAATFNSRV